MTNLVTSGMPRGRGWKGGVTPRTRKQLKPPEARLSMNVAMGVGYQLDTTGDLILNAIPVTVMQPHPYPTGHFHPGYCSFFPGPSQYQSPGFSLPIDPIPTHSALSRETFLCALVATTGTQTSSPRMTCASSTKSGDSLHHRAQTHHSQSFPTYTIIAGQSVCGYDAQTLCHPSLRYLMRYKSNRLQFTRLTWHQYLDCSYLN